MIAFVESLNSALTLGLGCMMLGAAVGGALVTKGRKEQKLDEVIGKLDRVGNDQSKATELSSQCANRLDTVVQDNEKLLKEFRELDISVRRKQNQQTAILQELFTEVFRRLDVLDSKGAKDDDSSNKLVRLWGDGF